MLNKMHKNRTKLPLNPVLYKPVLLKPPARFLHLNADRHDHLCLAHSYKPSLIGCMAKRRSNGSLIGGNVLLNSYWPAIMPLRLSNEIVAANSAWIKLSLSVN